MRARPGELHPQACSAPCNTVRGWIGDLACTIVQCIVRNQASRQSPRAPNTGHTIPNKMWLRHPFSQGGAADEIARPGPHTNKTAPYSCTTPHITNPLKRSGCT